MVIVPIDNHIEPVFNAGLNDALDLRHLDIRVEQVACLALGRDAKRSSDNRRLPVIGKVGNGGFAEELALPLAVEEAGTGKPHGLAVL